MEGYVNRKCKFPPPCPEYYSQFRMKGDGPNCCRKQSHSKGCPMGQFKCPISGICISNPKRCASVEQFRAKKAALFKEFAVPMKNKLRLPTFAMSFTGITGKTRDIKLAKARLILEGCRNLNVLLTNKNGI